MIMLRVVRSVVRVNVTALWHSFLYSQAVVNVGKYNDVLLIYTELFVIQGVYSFTLFEEFSVLLQPSLCGYEWV